MPKSKLSLKHEHTKNVYRLNAGGSPAIVQNVQIRTEKIKTSEVESASTVSLIDPNMEATPSGWYFYFNNRYQSISYVELISATQETYDDNIGRTNGQLNVTRRLNLNSLIPAKKRKIEIIADQFFLPKEIQTELTMECIDNLFRYYQAAVDERDELLQKLSTVLIDFNYFNGNDKKVRFFTGFQNWKLFSRFFDLVKNFVPTHFNCKLSKFQMIVLTIMKLRLNSSFTDLGYRFQVDANTASRTFHRCIYILYIKLKNSKIIHWPDEMNLTFSTPSYFKSQLKNVVTIIIDCFEIFTERPSMLRAAAQMFSTYKHHPTIKLLIGISMSGVIIFISKAFGGRTSDKEATKQSGFLDRLKEGDCVLADKGFLIRDEVNAKNAHLKMPCFVRNGNQLHPIELENSRKTSSLRIHVERVINTLREKFNICSDIAKISALSKRNEIFDRDLYDMVIFVCACIVNLCPSVVTSDFEI